MRRAVTAAIVILVGATLALPATAATGRLVEADPFTMTAGPLAAGELEVVTLSTRAATVTGGDVLIGVRGLDAQDDVVVTRNGADVSSAFGMGEDGVLTGLVDGLDDGENVIAVTSTHPTHGTRAATLPVTNHPVTGPVFSGPHQEPFICRTADAGLGEPVDDDCSIEPVVQWFYLSEVTRQFRELEDPYAAYPGDTATTTTSKGTTVPYVVRVETRTINRGITRIGVLDDPAARGPDAPFEAGEAWNGRMFHQYGASCAVGYQQGVNSTTSVLSGVVDASGSAPEGVPVVIEAPVGQGYVVVHSTLTTFGVNCNHVLSAETSLMIREHVTEQYGQPEITLGNGASGGALQQVLTMNGYPGILDGGVPMVTFPDVVTTAMSVGDCDLFQPIFNSNPVVWNELAMQAVTGHRTSQICRDWDILFAPILQADESCDASIPEEMIYDAETNPDGVRCTLQDSLVNQLGTDTPEGFAPRPLDNVGVQYGLEALEDGVITAQMFVDLNRDVGGLDLDGNPIPERMSMTDELAALLYERGYVTGRGTLDQSPSLFISTYIDVVPILGFHDAVRAYELRERLVEHVGTDRTQSIFAGLPLPNDAWPIIDEWATATEAARAAAGGVSDDGWQDEVVASRPDAAADTCVVTTAGFAGPLGLPLETGQPSGECEQIFEPLNGPRMVAGGPLSEDIVKCQLKPLDRADYDVTFTDDQWADLETAFPDGVCDWSKPGVGETATSRTWLSYGTTERVDEPSVIPNLVARSEVVEGAPATPTPAPSSSPTSPTAAPSSPSLPATGGGLAVVGLLAAAAAVARRRP